MGEGQLGSSVKDTHTNSVSTMDSQQGLSHSTQNSAQCQVAAGMGGELGGRRTHVYGWLSPLAVHLRPSQHCSSAVPQHKIKSLKIKNTKGCPAPGDSKSTVRQQVPSPVCLDSCFKMHRCTFLGTSARRHHKHCLLPPPAPWIGNGGVREVENVPKSIQQDNGRGDSRQKVPERPALRAPAQRPSVL